MSNISQSLDILVMQYAAIRCKILEQYNDVVKANPTLLFLLAWLYLYKGFISSNAKKYPMGACSAQIGTERRLMPTGTYAMIEIEKLCRQGMNGCE